MPKRWLPCIWPWQLLCRCCCIHALHPCTLAWARRRKTGGLRFHQERLFFWQISQEWLPWTNAKKLPFVACCHQDPAEVHPSFGFSFCIGLVLFQPGVSLLQRGLPSILQGRQCGIDLCHVLLARFAGPAPGRQLGWCWHLKGLLKPRLLSPSNPYSWWFCDRDLFGMLKWTLKHFESPGYS